MEKERIIEVLSRWNFWERDIDIGVPREGYVNKLLSFLGKGKIISVIGIRRAGKSTIIKQIAKKLLNNIKKEDILIINFEEPEFEGADLPLLQKIYDSYLEIIKPENKPFIFLDEIQNVPKWEKFARSLNERKEANIIISGSSSKLLSDELASVLAGRQIYFEIFPLSFKEFLVFNSVKIEEKKDILVNSQKIKSLMREYIEFGGYPEIVLSKEGEFKIRILRSYYDDILTKDIVRRFKIKEIEKLRALVRFYLTNVSSLITFNSVARFLDLSVETARRFTSYIEISKSLFFLKRFSFKVKEQEKSPRKVYSLDVGLSNALGFKFSGNLGKIIENIAAIELKRREDSNPDLSAYYWKNPQNEEVDFILKKGLEIEQLIQVCWDLSDYDTKEREIKALINASKELKCSDLLVITEDYEADEKIKGRRIKFIPLWKWLLQ